MVKKYKEFELIIPIFAFRLTLRQYIYKQTKNPKLAFLMAHSNKGQGFMHFCHERKWCRSRDNRKANNGSSLGFVCAI